MKVKLVKLDDRCAERTTEEEKERVGKIFEAFEIETDFEEGEYKNQYALNLGNCVWFVPTSCCEVVKETISEEELELLKIKPSEFTPNTTEKILLVEDGSVDVAKIEDWGIKCIVYRQGANKPEWL